MTWHDQVNQIHKNKKIMYQYMRKNKRFCFRCCHIHDPLLLESSMFRQNSNFVTPAIPRMGGMIRARVVPSQGVGEGGDADRAGKGRGGNLIN